MNKEKIKTNQEIEPVKKERKEILLDVSKNLKSLIQDLEMEGPLEKSHLEKMEEITKDILIANNEKSEEIIKDVKSEKKSVLDFFRNNKMIYKSLLVLSLMMPLKNVFSADFSEGGPKKEIIKDKEAINNKEKTYVFSEKEKSINLNIYSQFKVNKAELKNEKQVEADVNKFINDENIFKKIEDIEKMNRNTENRLEFVVFSGASPEKTSSWSEANFLNFIQENNIEISEDEMNNLKEEAQKYKEIDQEGNFWLSYARGKVLAIKIKESLEKEAQSNNRAQYILDNFNFVVQNKPTSENDFVNGIYSGEINEFLGMTYEEVRNAIFKVSANKKEVEEKIPVKPMKKLENKIEVITEMDLFKFEYLIEKYDGIVIDQSGSMGNTLPNFFINEFRKAGDTKKIREIQGYRTEKKEEKSDKINTKNYDKALIYTGVEGVKNKYSIKDGESLDRFIKIVSSLEYYGAKERGVNKINITLKDLIGLAKKSDKEWAKKKKISKSGNETTFKQETRNISLAYFTDESIKYTKKDFTEYQRLKEECEKMGYELKVDFIFSSKIGSNKDAKLIVIPMNSMEKYLENLIKKNPGTDIYQYNQPEIKQGSSSTAQILENVGEDL